MRRISYGTNSLHQTATIYFTYGPWWSFWLDDIGSWLCGRISRLWQPVGEFFHARVDMPISHWCWRHQDLRSVEVDYVKLKEALSGRDTEKWNLLKHWEREDSGET